jgi:hypothetical protein
VLVIRDAQMLIFQEVAVDEFSGAMVEHLRRCFPAQCAGRDDEDLRAFVDRLMTKALRHDIDDRVAVCKLVDVAMVFGEDFDTDPRCPWAAEALRDTSLTTPAGRVELLALRALDALRRRM